MKKKYPLLRDPYDSENQYFEKNPHVAGMATEDDRVIFNPHSSAIPNQSDSIYKNEASRIYMRKHGVRPDYELTEDQNSRFKGYGTPQDIAETIAGRGISGDESSGELTENQKQFIKKLSNQMIRDGWLDAQ